ncbi:amidohydrolase [Anaerostipes sp.]|uniref:amidohydrolase n=1 Tax=Anaerostipes sp. TaxID=1872530 RepID=UPI0025BA3269|nr:amidohydrolase [Anaerostipes sp.]MBS7007683.1 amidohydrolase [Anaerostipes sp.]
MEKIYFNGDILTMEEGREEPEAVLVSGQMIKFAGRLKDAKNLSEKADMIDLKGKTLMPAFIDSHSHISLVAQFSQFADLSGSESFEDIKERLMAYKKEQKSGDGGVIMGVGYDHNFLEEKKHPDKTVLDQISDQVPVFILHASGHMGVGNSALLRAAGIDASTKDIEGSRFGRVPGSMEPDGYAEETGALKRLLDQVYSKLSGDRKEQIMRAQEIYLSHGITTVQDGAASAGDVETLYEAAQNGSLQVDVVSYILVEEQTKQLEEKYSDLKEQYWHRMKLGGRKVILDGSPQGKTAWLSKPYEGEQDYRGYPAMKNRRVTEYAADAIGNGRQILAHCNGDAASEQWIECFRKAMKEAGAEDKDLRPVMIHCQTVRKDQLFRMKQIGMIPSIFVDHVYYWGDIHLKNLGKERAENISPARSAFEQGLCVNFHQDSPVIPPDMLHTVWCAVNRTTREGTVLGERERVSVYQALKAVTINGAYAYFEEDLKGSIAEGKLADLVILDQNPMKILPEKIREIKVEETVKEGRTVYRRG